MDIRYNVKRSRFYQPCVSVITAQAQNLSTPTGLSITLEGKNKEAGYPGSMTITIRKTDVNEFGTSWISKVKSRFPARIKAVATALRDCKRFGRFEVSHHAGSMRVREV